MEAAGWKGEEGEVRRACWERACLDGVRASGLAPGKRQQASAVQGYGSRNWGRACWEVGMGRPYRTRGDLLVGTWGDCPRLVWVAPLARRRAWGELGGGVWGKLEIGNSE